MLESIPAATVGTATWCDSTIVGAVVIRWQGIGQVLLEPSLVGESSHSRVEISPIQVVLVHYLMKLDELGFDSLRSMMLPNVLHDATRYCFPGHG